MPFWPLTMTKATNMSSAGPSTMEELLIRSRKPHDSSSNEIEEQVASQGKRGRPRALSFSSETSRDSDENGDSGYHEEEGSGSVSSRENANGNGNSDGDHKEGSDDDGSSAVIVEVGSSKGKDTNASKKASATTTKAGSEQTTVSNGPIWRSTKDGCSRCSSLGIECIVDVNKGRVVKCEKCRKEERAAEKCNPKFDKEFSKRFKARLLKQRKPRKTAVDKRKSEPEIDSDEELEAIRVHRQMSVDPKTPTQKKSKKRKIEMSQTDRTPSLSRPAKSGGHVAGADEGTSSVAMDEMDTVMACPRRSYSVPPQQLASTPLVTAPVNMNTAPSASFKMAEEAILNIPRQAITLKKKQVVRVRDFLGDILKEAQDPSTVRYLVRKIAEEHGKAADSHV